MATDRAASASDPSLISSPASASAASPPSFGVRSSGALGPSCTDPQRRCNEPLGPPAPPIGLATATGPRRNLLPPLSLDALPTTHPVPATHAGLSSRGSGAWSDAQELAEAHAWAARAKEAPL